MVTRIRGNLSKLPPPPPLLLLPFLAFSQLLVEVQATLSIAYGIEGTDPITTSLFQYYGPHHKNIVAPAVVVEAAELCTPDPEVVQGKIVLSRGAGSLCDIDAIYRALDHAGAAAYVSNGFTIIPGVDTFSHASWNEDAMGSRRMTMVEVYVDDPHFCSWKDVAAAAAAADAGDRQQLVLRLEPPHSDSFYAVFTGYWWWVGVRGVLPLAALWTSWLALSEGWRTRKELRAQHPSHRRELRGVGVLVCFLEGAVTLLLGFVTALGQGGPTVLPVWVHRSFSTLLAGTGTTVTVLLVLIMHEQVRIAPPCALPPRSFWRAHRWTMAAVFLVGIGGDVATAAFFSHSAMTAGFALFFCLACLLVHLCVALFFVYLAQSLSAPLVRYLRARKSYTRRLSLLLEKQAQLQQEAQQGTFAGGSDFMAGIEAVGGGGGGGGGESSNSSSKYQKPQPQPQPQQQQQQQQQQQSQRLAVSPVSLVSHPSILLLPGARLPPIKKSAAVHPELEQPPPLPFSALTPRTAPTTTTTVAAAAAAAAATNAAPLASSSSSSSSSTSLPQSPMPMQPQIIIRAAATEKKGDTLAIERTAKSPPPVDVQNAASNDAAAAARAKGGVNGGVDGGASRVGMRVGTPVATMAHAVAMWEDIAGQDPEDCRQDHQRQRIKDIVRRLTLVLAGNGFALLLVLVAEVCVLVALQTGAPSPAMYRTVAFFAIGARFNLSFWHVRFVAKSRQPARNQQQHQQQQQHRHHFFANLAADWVGRHCCCFCCAKKEPPPSPVAEMTNNGFRRRGTRNKRGGGGGVRGKNNRRVVPTVPSIAGGGGGDGGGGVGGTSAGGHVEDGSLSGSGGGGGGGGFGCGFSHAESTTLSGGDQNKNQNQNVATTSPSRLRWSNSHYRDHNADLILETFGGRGGLGGGDQKQQQQFRPRMYAKEHAGGGLLCGGGTQSSSSSFNTLVCRSPTLTSASIAHYDPHSVPMPLDLTSSLCSNQDFEFFVEGELGTIAAAIPAPVGGGSVGGGGGGGGGDGGCDCQRCR